MILYIITPPFKNKNKIFFFIGLLFKRLMAKLIISKAIKSFKIINCILAVFMDKKMVIQHHHHPSIVNLSDNKFQRRLFWISFSAKSYFGLHILVISFFFSNELTCMIYFFRSFFFFQVNLFYYCCLFLLCFLNCPFL